MADYFQLRNTKSGIYTSSHPKVFLGKGVLKICSKFTGEHPCRGVISIKLHSIFKPHFIKTTLRHGCFPVNLGVFLHIFRTHFSRNTFGWLLLCLMFTG